MYPSKDARELSVLLRISRELDIGGDVTATVDNPPELLAWASILSDAEIVAWPSTDSGHRYLQVTADRHTAPIRGRVTAVLPCDSTQSSGTHSGSTDSTTPPSPTSPGPHCRRPGPTCPSHHRRPTAQAKPVAGLPHETPSPGRWA